MSASPALVGQSSPALLERDALKRWCIALLAVGIGWRLARWGVAAPLWGDEAYIGLNVLERSWRELLLPLDFLQVSPIGFLWSQRAMILVFGGHEWIARLLPTIAGIAALAIYARFAGRRLDWPAAVLAVGILAVAYYPVRHGAEFKPYAFDLLAAVVVISLAARWLEDADRRAAVWLAALMPFIVLSSYPAVFVAGGAVASAVLVAVRRRDRRLMLESLWVGGVLCIAFAASYWFTIAPQSASIPGQLQNMFEDACPPAGFLPLLRWLAWVHTGNMFAYPTGSGHGGSVLTFALFIMGAISLWRGGRGRLLAILLAPFALTFVAAALRMYPYGVTARVAQHLAPSICLLAGVGLIAVLKNAPWQPATSRKVLVGVLAVLLLFGVGGTASSIAKPYKTKDYREVRRIVTDLAGRSDCALMVFNPRAAVPATFRWYFGVLAPNTPYLETGTQPAPPLEHGVCALVFHRDSSAFASVDGGRSRVLDRETELYIEDAPVHVRTVVWTAPRTG